MLVGLSGCTIVLNKEHRPEVENISPLKNELSEIQRARQELEGRFAKEIADDEVKVEILQKGLVIAFVAGEYRPVESNDTKEARKRNRRVEILILPRVPQAVFNSVD